jgi:hypothetical protein
LYQKLQIRIHAHRITRNLRVGGAKFLAASVKIAYKSQLFASYD